MGESWYYFYLWMVMVYLPDESLSAAMIKIKIIFLLFYSWTMCLFEYFWAAAAKSMEYFCLNYRFLDS